MEKSKDFLKILSFFGKMYYNILLDDRAGLYEAYCILKRLIAHIKLTKTIKSVVK